MKARGWFGVFVVIAVLVVLSSIGSDTDTWCPPDHPACSGSE